MARDVTGADKVQAAFGRVSAKAAEHIAAALNAGAAEMVQRAKTLAPVSNDDQPGQLRAAIKYRMETGRRGVAAVVYVDNEIAKKRSRKFPKGFPYATVVEFGRAARARGEAFRDRSGRRRFSGGTRAADAQPFFWPAYWSVRNRIIARVRRAMTMAAKEAARNGR